MLVRQLIKTCIEKLQDHQAGPRDDSNRLLKLRNPDLYSGYLHMGCYYFCQQCEDYFKIAGTQGHKRITFAADSLKDCIFNRCAPLFWDKFKAFLKKSLGKSDPFVSHIWEKMRRNFQYSLEEVQNWAAHLEHLQCILL